MKKFSNGNGKIIMICSSVILFIPELIMQEVGGQNGTPYQSLGIDLAQFLGLSAAVSGVISASVNYLFNKRRVIDDRQLQAMKDKTNACSQFCFYLRRMILNDDFQLHAEDVELIENTFAEIDERIKNNFYLLDDTVRLKWISVRSNWSREYDQNHMEFINKAIELNNSASEVLNKLRGQIKKSMNVTIDKVEMLRFEDLTHYPTVKFLTLVDQFADEATSSINNPTIILRKLEEFTSVVSSLSPRMSQDFPEWLQTYNEGLKSLLQSPTQQRDQDLQQKIRYLTGDISNNVKRWSGYD